MTSPRLAVSRNPARQRHLDALTGAGVAPRDKTRVANRAVRDAGQLADDVRALDPAEVWRTLARWAINEPDRLIAAAFAAVAMLPVDDMSHRELLAWIDTAPGLTLIRREQEPLERGA